MNLTKNYLTIEEIANIVDQMVTHNISYNREITKVSLVSQYCTDGNFTDKTDVEIYNMVAEDGILDEYDMQIHNYYMIDKMVKEDIGIEKNVGEFLTNLDKKVDEVMKKMPKDFNLKDFFGNIKKAINNDENV